jgi:hypothetical protein
VAEANVSGRRSWLSSRRAKAALLIAGVEGLFLLFGRLSRWVLIVVAIPLILTYLVRGRQMRPGLGRDVLWIVAASQALVLVAAILAFFIGLLFLILLAAFAIVALLLIYLAEP